MSSNLKKLYGKVEQRDHERCYTFLAMHEIGVEEPESGPLLEMLGLIGQRDSRLFDQAVIDAKLIFAEWKANPEVRSALVYFGGNVDKQVHAWWKAFAHEHGVYINTLLAALLRSLPLDGELPGEWREAVDGAKRIWAERRR